MSKSIESPKAQWEDLKLSVYGNIKMHRNHEGECSTIFYAGMVAGVLTTLQICSQNKAQDQGHVIQKYLQEIRVLAIANKPTGKN